MRHHVVILHTPYIEALLEGRKTIECRMGRWGNGPQYPVAGGDVLWFKETCGPIRVVAAVGQVQVLGGLTPAGVDRLRVEYNPQIAGQDDFWRQSQQARWAMLMWLTRICPLQPFHVAKRDRRAWVVLGQPPIPGRALVGWRLPTDGLPDPRGLA